MKLNKWKLIWLLLTNKKNKKYGYDFIYFFEETILYALRNYKEKRGKGSCEVFLFSESYNIFKEK